MRRARQSAHLGAEVMMKPVVGREDEDGRGRTIRFGMSGDRLSVQETATRTRQKIGCRQTRVTETLNLQKVSRRRAARPELDWRFDSRGPLESGAAGGAALVGSTSHETTGPCCRTNASSVVRQFRQARRLG